LKTSYAPEKLYRSNKVLSHILVCNENLAKDVFRESELKSVSSQDYSVLLSNELLTETFKTPRGIYYDGNKTAYKIYKEDDGYYGYRLNGDGESRIKLSMNFREFNWKKFLELLKRKNELNGKGDSLTARMRFVGYHKRERDDIAVILGLFPSDRICESEVLGLPSRVDAAKKFLVLCPQYSIESMELNTKLSDKGIFCRQFDSVLNNDLKIDFSVIRSEATVIENFVMPPLTATEQRKYSRDYPRRDVIAFTDKEVGARSFEVLVNGRPVQLEYNLFGLLLCLAIGLKNNIDKGWVSLDKVLNRERLVRSQQHFHRSMSELCKKIMPVEENKIKIVQNLKRQGKYRLSTMPSRIRAPHTKWISSQYRKIKAEILKERAKRIGEENI